MLENKMKTDKFAEYQKLKAELGIRTALDDGFEPDFLTGGALREKSIRGDYTPTQWREMREMRERGRPHRRTRTKV